MIEEIKNKINRNCLLLNFIHLFVQYFYFSIKSKFGYNFLYRAGWRKDSDTLVIVAAGPSFNELSVEQWQELNRFDVLGLSYGGLAPVQVAGFVCEFAPPRLRSNQIALFKALNQRYATSDRPPICFWKHPEHVTNLEHLEIPVRKILTLVIPALRRSALNKVTRFITALGIHKLFVFQSAGSVSSLLMMARAFEYKRVIFVGLDVTDRRYFFEENQEFANIGLKNPFLLSGEEDLTKTHQIAMSFGDIEDFSKRLEIAAGEAITLTVSSHSSALSAFWPVHSFSAGETNES